MIIFKGLIKCLNCGKNYKHKLIKGESYYICSGYSNYGKSFCSNYTIKQDEISEAVQRHIELVQQKKLSKPARDYIKTVEVKGEGYRIIYNDGSNSLMNYPNEHGMICIRY